jgi:hypothetical protein
MNRLKSILSQALLLSLPLGAAVAIGAPTVAQAQEAAPPAEFVASFTPEYFEGRPVYYYRNMWYYRDGNRWSYYRSEPAYLRDRRSHWEHERSHYHYHR